MGAPEQPKPPHKVAKVPGKRPLTRINLNGLEGRIQKRLAQNDVDDKTASFRPKAVEPHPEPQKPGLRKIDLEGLSERIKQRANNKSQLVPPSVLTQQKKKMMLKYGVFGALAGSIACFPVGTVIGFIIGRNIGLQEWKKKALRALD